MRSLLVLLAAAALTGCGGTGGGKATLWVTRDRGAAVLLVRRVPAGLTAMQALVRVADVKTRYAGRFVQAIDGIAGSLTRQEDWFYFVNGYEADRSAAEYRLHPGDLEWWDFRSWSKQESVPVVVGAFPEPFLHGYDGRRRPAVVAYDSATRAQAASVAQRLHARLVALGAPVARDANVLEFVCPVYPGHPSIEARLRSRGGGPGDPVAFVVTCEPRFEARARFHYEVVL